MHRYVDAAGNELVGYDWYLSNVKHSSLAISLSHLIITCFPCSLPLYREPGRAEMPASSSAKQRRAVVSVQNRRSQTPPQMTFLRDNRPRLIRDGFTNINYWPFRSRLLTKAS